MLHAVLCNNQCIYAADKFLQAPNTTTSASGSRAATQDGRRTPPSASANTTTSASGSRAATQDRRRTPPSGSQAEAQDWTGTPPGPLDADPTPGTGPATRPRRATPVVESNLTVTTRTKADIV